MRNFPANRPHVSLASHVRGCLPAVTAAGRAWWIAATFVLLAGCGGAGLGLADDEGGAPGACSPGDDPLGLAALRQTVETLADPALLGREPGTAGDQATRRYIADRFTCAGLEAPGGRRQQPFLADDDAPTANVIGVIRGTDPAVRDQIIVIGAHHDHLGQDDEGIYRGASDNASGVGVLLGLAEVIAARDVGPRRTVVFVAFGAEEQGYYGSEHYAANTPPGLALADTVFMVNLDMLGTYAAEGHLYALHTFEGTPGRTILDDLVDDFPALDVVLGVAGAESDHLAFCEAGMPTTFFFTEDTACHHAPCDVPEHLDWPNYAQIARLVLATVDRLADGELDLRAARMAGCGTP